MNSSVSRVDSSLVRGDLDLAGLNVGETAYVSDVVGDSVFRERILEMGLVPGQEVKVERKAPLGDPLVIRVQGYQLGLRQNQARAVGVVREKPAPQTWEGEERSLTSEKSSDLKRFALLGNPNCGKTTLFNALTGMRQKVGNYSGVTIERRVGGCESKGGEAYQLLDLPGTYSMNATSPDERIAVSVVKGELADENPLDGIVLVVDASNLSRNLYLFTQASECGLPMVVVLTLNDTAARKGVSVNATALESMLGVPVIPVAAHKGKGTEGVVEALKEARRPSLTHWELNEEVSLQERVASRYNWIEEVRQKSIGNIEPVQTFSDRLDKVLVHRFWGLFLFVGLMYFIFFLTYTVADPFMGMAEDGVSALGQLLFGSMGEGALRSLLLDGVIGGVGGVLVFVPQIAMLFLCITILEESGYLSRAAFLLDRLLAAFGLHGKSFIPLLTSHACAIPGIMASRGIENHRDRLATMLVAPFMSCGARLPVYALMIGAFLSSYGSALMSLVLLGCYTLGIVVAIVISLLLKKTVLKPSNAALILELPHYQLPRPNQVLRVVLRNSWLFVRKAGTIILAFSILLWASLYYPHLSEAEVNGILAKSGLSAERFEEVSSISDETADLSEAEVSAFLEKAGVSSKEVDHVAKVSGLISGAQMEGSVAGIMGKAIEPMIAPLGYDWKIGVGLIGAFAAREVFVATMGVVYSVGEDQDEESEGLHQAMKADLKPNGNPLWDLPTVFSILVFFVIAMQCISTVAVMRQETGSWKWPIIQLVGMNVLAYVLALLVYQIGVRL